MINTIVKIFINFNFKFQIYCNQVNVSTSLTLLTNNLTAVEDYEFGKNYSYKNNPNQKPKWFEKVKLSGIKNLIYRSVHFRIRFLNFLFKCQL